VRQIGYIQVEDWLSSGNQRVEPASGQLTLTGKVPTVDIAFT